MRNGGGDWSTTHLSALKELLDEGVADCSLVNMNVFKGLSAMETIEIGFHDNKMIKLGKTLSFIDLVNC